MRIKIDTREQQSYTFNTPSEVGTLEIGDYSITGLESYIAIERKELNDLIGCLTSGRERFEKELRKGKALDCFALVIEASLSDIAQGNYRSEMQPRAAIQSLIAFSLRYRLPVWFCESWEYAQRLTESLLLKYAKELKRRHQAVSGIQENGCEDMYSMTSSTQQGQKKRGVGGARGCERRGPCEYIL